MKYKVIILLLAIAIIPTSMALRGTGGGYSIEGNAGSAGGMEDDSGINVSIISTFAVKEAASTRLYGGIFCILNRHPLITLGSVTPGAANASQTIVVGAVIEDNDNDNVKVKAYTDSSKTTLLCTGDTVGSGGNSTCTFPSTGTGCADGECDIYLFAEDISNECEGSSSSPESIVTFISDMAAPSISSLSPNTSSIGFARPEGNLTITFKYTEINPLNYSIEVYDGSNTICMKTNTSMVSGIGVNVTENCTITAGATDSFYTLRVTIFDIITQSIQNTQAGAVQIDSIPPVGNVSVNVTEQINGTDFLQGLVPLFAIDIDISDNVSHASWYYDDNLIGTDYTYPFSMDWNTTIVPDGAYNVTVRIYDMAGNYVIAG